MMKVIITEQAASDLVTIGEYLMQHSPGATMRLMKTFRKKFNLLATFPMLGRARDDVLLGARCLVVKEYLIFYQPGDSIVEILRVRHSAQEQQDLFKV